MITLTKSASDYSLGTVFILKISEVHSFLLSSLLKLITHFYNYNLFHFLVPDPMPT